MQNGVSCDSQCSGRREQPPRLAKCNMLLKISASYFSDNYAMTEREIEKERERERERESSANATHSVYCVWPCQILCWNQIRIQYMCICIEQSWFFLKKIKGLIVDTLSLNSIWSVGEDLWHSSNMIGKYMPSINYNDDRRHNTHQLKVMYFH